MKKEDLKTGMKVIFDHKTANYIYLTVGEINERVIYLKLPEEYKSKCLVATDMFDLLYPYLTELPEKWAIKLTKENQSDFIRLQNKLSEEYNLPCSYTDIDYYYYNDSPISSSKLKEGYTEIQINQFERLYI